MTKQMLEFVGADEMSLCCLRSIAKSGIQFAGRQVRCDCGSIFHSNMLNPRDLGDLNAVDMVTKGIMFTPGWSEEGMKDWFFKSSDRFRPVKVSTEQGTHWFPQAPDSWCDKDDRRCVVIDPGVVALFYGKSDLAPRTPAFAPTLTLKEDPGTWCIEVEEEEDTEKAEEVEKPNMDGTGPVGGQGPGTGRRQGLMNGAVKCEKCGFQYKATLKVCPKCGAPNRALLKKEGKEEEATEKTDARRYFAEGKLSPAQNHTHSFEGPIDMAGELLVVTTKSDGHSHIIRVGALTPGSFEGTSSTDMGHNHVFKGTYGPTVIVPGADASVTVE